MSTKEGKIMISIRELCDKYGAQEDRTVLAFRWAAEADHHAVGLSPRISCDYSREAQARSGKLWEESYDLSGSEPQRLINRYIESRKLYTRSMLAARGLDGPWPWDIYRGYRNLGGGPSWHTGNRALTYDAWDCRKALREYDGLTAHDSPAETRNAFRAALRAACAAAKLTPASAAERLGVSESVYREWERGALTPPKSTQESVLKGMEKTDE
ncbi:MAG: helix-turn-helix domain-containing protein [Clostridiales bacterium]|jgi:hypothetical protein|nr:helix-turn-helix domain-containing protein [Clostridiales bacterium]